MQYISEKHKCWNEGVAGVSQGSILGSPLFKKEKKQKNGCVMPAHVECAKSTFNILVLLTKNRNVFFSQTPLL